METQHVFSVQGCARNKLFLDICQKTCLLTFYQKQLKKLLLFLREKQGKEKGRDREREGQSEDFKRGGVTGGKRLVVQIHHHSPLFRFFDVKFVSTCQTEYSLMPTPSSKVTAALSAREGRGQ